MVEIPGYRIESELGRGGMATVYLALQESVERRVALKVMSPVLLVDRSFTDRFIREARIAANLYHPHIVAVHDVGVAGDQPFIAMEHLPGEDLASRIQRHEIDLPSALRIIREMASALDYAHQKGFVHRDVKPENILFRADGTAVLTDFGIARAVNSVTQMTKTGAVIGTPQYMSPEQARGRDVDGRSDLYGLGIVLYEVLTGTVPFEGADSIAVGIKHVTEPVPQLPSRFARVQPIMDRFVAKHPEDRYQTGAEALVDLKALEAAVISGGPARKRTPPAQPALGETAVAPRPVTPPAKSPAPPAARSPRRDPPARAGASDNTLHRTSVAATPRPDGSLRQEPTLGSLDDFSSFDRTVSQPSFADLEIPHAHSRRISAEIPPRSKRGPVLLLLLVVVVAAGWWQRDALLAMLPDREVNRLLERAQTAVQYKHWYGDTTQYANRLYQRVLELDPDNSRGRAGLDLVAMHLLDEAEKASGDGNATQAKLLLDRARELAPGHRRVAAVAAQLGAPAPTNPDDMVENRLEARLGELLTEADMLEAQGQFVRPPGENALSRFEAVLALDPANQRAQRGIARVTETMLGRFLEPLDKGQLALARERLADLGLILTDAELSQYRTALGAAEQLEREGQRARQEAAAQEQARRQAQAIEQRELDQALAAAERALGAGNLGGNDGAATLYRRVLERDPQNSAAKAGLRNVAQRYLQFAEVALEDDRLDVAQEHIETIATLSPSLPGLQRARDRLELYRGQREQRISLADRQRMEQLVADAKRAMARNDLMEPPGDSAYDLLKSALRIGPNAPEVEEGLTALASRLIELADDALDRNEPVAATLRLGQAQQANARHPAIAALRQRIGIALRQSVMAAITQGDLSAAEDRLQRASDLEPNHPELEALQLQLAIARDSTG